MCLHFALFSCRTTHQTQLKILRRQLSAPLLFERFSSASIYHSQTPGDPDAHNLLLSGCYSSFIHETMAFFSVGNWYCIVKSLQDTLLMVHT